MCVLVGLMPLSKLTDRLREVTTRHHNFVSRLVKLRVNIYVYTPIYLLPLASGAILAYFYNVY